MLPLHQRHYLLVDLSLGLGGAGQRGVTAQILIGNGLQRHHVEIVAHAVPGDHGTGQLGGLLNIIGGTGGDGAEGYFLRRPAGMASGASGAELANMINEAALRAVRNHRTVVTEADLEESIEVVIAGYQKKNAVLSDHEKQVVSYHEIGHALVAALQTHSAPVQKITIIPRTSGALGYTMQVDTADKNLMTKEEIENKIATFTGGRAAEEVAFGEITTGASNDIEQATKLARAMITRYGMSEEFDMVAMETVTNQYLGGDTSLACSADTQNRIDAKVVELVKTQHQKAKNILLENREKLDELAKYLYEKETITGEEFMRILGQEIKAQ